MLYELKGDLFNVDESYMLAHCVGSDFCMGAGIAVEFKRRFGYQDYLIATCRGVGTCTVIKAKDIYKQSDYIVGYLVTKLRSNGKPTYQTLEASLIEMFGTVKANGITKIAMPRIGCGLDRLSWIVVKDMLKRLCPEGVEIHVYSL